MPIVGLDEANIRKIVQYHSQNVWKYSLIIQKNTYIKILLKILKDKNSF